MNERTHVAAWVRFKPFLPTAPTIAYDRLRSTPANRLSWAFMPESAPLTYPDYDRLRSPTIDPCESPELGFYTRIRTFDLPWLGPSRTVFVNAWERG